VIVTVMMTAISCLAVGCCSCSVAGVPSIFMTRLVMCGYAEGHQSHSDQKHL
jgi:hypothetical protein